MSATGILQCVLYLVVLIGLARPLGTWMARVYEGEKIPLDPVLKPVERLLYAPGVKGANKKKKGAGT